MKRLCWTGSLMLVCGTVAVGQSPAQPGKATPPGKTTAPSVAAPAGGPEAWAVIDAELAAPAPNMKRAEQELTRRFDRLIAVTPVEEAGLFRDAAMARRLVEQVAKLPKGSQASALKLLRERPRLAGVMAFLVQPEDDVPAVYKLLARLAEESGADLDVYAELAAAVCVVHDKPVVKYVNEKTAKAGDPVELFKYFVANEGSMAYGLKETPAEVLVYVVDAAASIDELSWALKKYGRDPMIGNRYREVPYDTDSVKRHTVKKSTAAGWNMRTIQKLGGVCVDQAYFASHVGKATGVPTVDVHATDGSVGHAWLGYLKKERGSVVWDFSCGRYESYQNVRGNLADPQTNKEMPDAFVGISASFVVQPREARQESRALVDAAMRLMLVTSGRVPFPPVDAGAPTPPPESAPAKTGPGKGGGQAAKVVARKATYDDALELLQAGLRAGPANVEGWRVLTKMAADGRLTEKQKSEWMELIDKVCGKAYPDFMYEILVPMIAAETDGAEEDRDWEWAFKKFHARPDLAARIRLAQGRMWEKEGDSGRAWKCYGDAVEKYLNDGPDAVEAAQRMAQLLKAGGKESQVVGLYEKTWRRTQQPRGYTLEFTRGSNWYRLGVMYADALVGAAREKDAQKVMDQLSDK